MKQPRHVVAVTTLLLALAGIIKADVMKITDSSGTVGGGNLSALAFDSTGNSYICSGHSAGVDMRIGEVMDASTVPWMVSTSAAMNTFQRNIFVRAGMPSRVASYNHWGANSAPSDDTYFLYGCVALKQSSSSPRMDEEPDVTKYYPDFPDSPSLNPTNCWVSNAGGTYKLVDDNLDDATGFVASGVQPGNQIVMYAVLDEFYNAPEIYAGIYTIAQVVSNTEIHLDRDPIYSTNETESNVGYVLSAQPHVTLEAFRQNLDYFANNTYSGPEFVNKGDLSPDGNTLYLGETVTNNIVAVNTATPNQVSVFVDNSRLQNYVQDQVDAGRRFLGSKLRIYTDFVFPYWYDDSRDCLVVARSSEQIQEGVRALKATFETAEAELAFRRWDRANSSFEYMGTLEFWIHGGLNGGQQLSVSLMDTLGDSDPLNDIGEFVQLDPLVAGTWNQVSIDVSGFFDPANPQEYVDRLVFRNDAATSQEAFYVDGIVVQWGETIPAEATFNPDLARLDRTQVATDSQGHLWFAEGETDDIVWTDDGVTINTFVTSDEIVEATDIEPTSACMTGIRVVALAIDPMGTVYWVDHGTRSVYKAPAAAPTNISVLATNDQLVSGLGVGPSYTGLGSIEIRDGQLITYAEGSVPGNFLVAIDLNTFDYGDFDGDFDVDDDDFDVFWCCFDPNCTCTAEEYGWADLDGDGDVDIIDYGWFITYYTG